jgi:endonuclease/exonuclease/phosphatase family metal-dependent hydrolase
MAVRLCSYNIEWFDKAFNADNTLKTDEDSLRQLDAVAAALKLMDPDLVGVVEGADTSKSSPKNTVACLEAFARAYDLRTAKALTGYVSAGQQELAILYDPAKLSAGWQPGGKAGDRDNPPFDGEIYIDTNSDRIVEVYTHFRPPLEAEITRVGGEGKFRLLVVHAKSKGMFDRYDMVHYQREAERNRRKLFGECLHIRRRLNEWQDQGHEFVVMGDVNDGPGMDSYEARFGRSAVEMILGDLFDSARSLIHHGEVPRWTGHGWRPWTTRYEAAFTEDTVRAMIDHIFTSRGITAAGAFPQTTYWNWDHPLMDFKGSDTDAERAEKERISQIFKDASDHFPVTLDIEWPG